MVSASGQAVLEYVLLLGVGVVIGFIILNQLFGTSEESKGFRLAWKCMIQSIGQDLPGHSLPRNPGCP